MNILQQPFPREHSLRKNLLNALISGVIVAVFLRVFTPFDFASAPVKSLDLFAAGYGIVTAVVIILYALFEYVFPSLFVEDKWTVGKNILVYIVIIFLIGSANLFYTSLFAGMRITLKTFLTFQLFTLSVTFIVVGSFTMIRYFRTMAFYKKDAQVLENEMHRLASSNEKTVITLKSENEKENLQLLLNDLLHIESADNYSKVVYRSGGKIVSTMLRSSLKRFEEQFTQPELFRCHRTFIVQLRCK